MTKPNNGIAINPGTTVPNTRKYKRNEILKDVDSKAIFQFCLDCGILTFDNAIGLGMEAIMKTLFDSVHHFDIYQAKDGRWVTYVPDPTRPNGRRDVKRKSKADLYKFLIGFYGVVANNPNAVNLKFEELFKEWVEYKKQFIGVENSKKSLSPLTIRRYELDFDRYIDGTDFAKMDMTSITATDIEKFLLKAIAKHKMSDTCANNVIGYFNQAFAYARRSRYLSENPMDLVDKTLLLAGCAVSAPKADQDRILSPKELASLKDVLLKQEELNPGYMPNYAVELAMLTGMRVGELAALKWSCVDDMYIHIDFSEHRLDYKGMPIQYVVGEPKNRKHRVIPITPEIRKLFMKIRAVSPCRDSEYVFVDENGDRYLGKLIGLAATRRCRNAGIEYGSIHRIRRTVSSLLNQDLPQKVVAELLGHTETVNEMHYNYSVAETSEKVAALSHVAEIISIDGEKAGKTG